jgi:endonuclease/exonuclease/phosphatase family metal-dependent hydrolase
LFTHISGFFKKVSHRTSSIWWLAKALGFPSSSPESQDPGLVLIQIDGLSHSALHREISRGKLPFLKRLLAEEGYQIRHHYSGIPSSTPAVQGELFYGVKQCVPAFKYLDSRSKEVFLFFRPENAAKIEKRISRGNPGLLHGGSSYGNVFSGGAAESHFCVAGMGARSYWKTFAPYSYMIGIFFNPMSLLRSFLKAVYDITLTVGEALTGILNRHDFWEELATIPVRIFVSIFLHDFITLGCRVDIARGLPVISVNFFAFDEFAHRYGASGFLTKRALAAIDRSVRKIWLAANRSLSRDYEVWIYSDHGQENTVPYRLVTGVPVEEAVDEVFHAVMPHKSAPATLPWEDPVGLGGDWVHHWRGTRQRKNARARQHRSGVIVTAQGPLGFVYPPYEMTDEDKDKVAERMTRKAQIPLVLAKDATGRVHAWTETGKFSLPEDGARIFGKDHPYLAEVVREMEQLCLGVESGTFVISGWRPNEKPVSFPLEWASHGGPGTQETDGFLLLPWDAKVASREHSKFLRPLDLRDGILNFMDKEKRESSYRVSVERPKDRPFRVMSYNVHRCVGMDRRLSPARIARVIARYNPDVVAMQELEHYGSKPGTIHQPEKIAKLLDMTYHFHPAMKIEEEHFGEAILSRHPMRLVKAGALPGLRPLRALVEPRGALWVEIDFFGKKIQLVASHLGIMKRECEMQVAELLGPNWLGHESCQRNPTIFCADMNTLPFWKASKQMKRKMSDVFGPKSMAKPSPTFLSTAPLIRIDYIYTSPEIKVVNAVIPRTALERIASDHLPVVADLTF